MDIERIIKLGLLVIVEGAIGLWGIDTISNVNVPVLDKLPFVLLIAIMLVVDPILYFSGKN